MEDVRGRLKRILQNDKSVPSRMEQVLKSEVYGVLQSYLELRQDDLDIVIEVNSLGVYEIKLTAKATAVKTFYQV